MANENRLIDANAFLKALNERPLDFLDVGGDFGYFDETIDSVMNEQPTIDAVEVNKYEALVGMYHDLRENFVDYVCSGIRNEAPYCLNKCEVCVDKRGWCKLEKCQGFNPAEVILDRYAKMDGDGNA